MPEPGRVCLCPSHWVPLIIDEGVEPGPLPAQLGNCKPEPPDGARDLDGRDRRDLQPRPPK
eukprot:15219254-Alexandrium_andersonii.AAC.1